MSLNDRKCGPETEKRQTTGDFINPNDKDNYSDEGQDASYSTD